MNDQDPSAPTEKRLNELEPSLSPRGHSPGSVGSRSSDAPSESNQDSPIFKKALEILRQQSSGRILSESVEEGRDAERSATTTAEPPPIVPTPLSPAPHIADRKSRIESDAIPARMLNEFVYCQRLFYYEFVEGVFVESADTLRGGAIHQRVDSGNGALPKAKRKAETDKSKTEEKTAEAKSESSQSTSPQPSPHSGEGENETIHSRSVQMGSERLGVVAKMDLVESKAEKADLLTALEVCPVDYKAGAPKEGENSNELWDTDKMQLGLQTLVLRDNGYTCNEGVIYYRATKQRVRLLITPELEVWILQNIAEAKRVITGPIPAPLVLQQA